MEYVNNGYGWRFKDNGDRSIGVDYFDANGNPISNTQFAQGTANTSAPPVANIERAAQQGYQSYDSWAGDNGLPNSTGIMDNPATSQKTNQTDAQNQALGSNNPNIAPNWNQAPATQQTSQQTGGSTGGTSGGTKLFDYNGVRYDGNNPQDMQAYYAVRSGEIDKQLSDALKNGQFDQVKQLVDYKAQWDQQGKDLLAGYGQGVTNRQQYFQGLGGRAYQSSMGTSGQFALDQLGQAQTQRNTDLASNNTAMDRAYQQFIDQNTQTAQTAKDTLANAQPGMDTNPTLAGYTPQQGAQTDISQYTPYTTFSQLVNSPMAQPAGVSGMTLSAKLKQLQDPNTFNLNDYMLGKAGV
jgi:hypothetical protein